MADYRISTCFQYTTSCHASFGQLEGVVVLPGSLSFPMLQQVSSISLLFDALTHLDKQLPSVCHVVSVPAVVFNRSDPKEKKCTSEPLYNAFVTGWLQLRQ